MVNSDHNLTINWISIHLMLYSPGTVSALKVVRQYGAIVLMRNIMYIFCSASERVSQTRYDVRCLGDVRR